MRKLLNTTQFTNKATEKKTISTVYNIHVNDVQHCTTLYSVVQYSTVQYITVQYSTV